MSKNNNKQRSRKRIAQNNKPSLQVTRPRFTPLPGRTYVQLKYVAVGQLNTPSVAGSFTENTWQSSVFDPDYTGVGHQPMYFDQYALMYYAYRVFGFKYKIEVTNGGSWGAHIYVAHKPDSGTPGSSSIETEMERPSTKFRCILPSASGMNHKTITGYVDVAKVWGLSRSEFLANDSFLSYVITSPQKLASLHFGFGMSGASTTTLDISVQLDFDVEFYKRYDTAGS